MSPTFEKDFALLDMLSSCSIELPILKECNSYPPIKCSPGKYVYKRIEKNRISKKEL